jgi:hypothetical protein
MRIKHPIALGSLTVLLALVAYGQEFEVADVRVNKLEEPPSAAFLPSGQLTLRGVTMKTLVGIAFKESRVLPEVDATATAMVIAKGGPKLKAADGSSDTACVRSISEDHRDCHNMTTAKLAEQLPSFAPRFF